jgi:hypothetical protein
MKLCECENNTRIERKKIPIIRIDNSLKKYKTMPIFQDKVDSANEMLRTVGLPKMTIN